MKQKQFQHNPQNKLQNNQNHLLQEEINSKFTKHSVKGILGTTWDATHMTSFLRKSFYSNNSPQNRQTSLSFFRKSLQIKKKQDSPKYVGEHFFRTVKDTKNMSKMGFSKINPLITSINIQRQAKSKSIQKIFQKKIFNQNNHKLNQIKHFLCSSDLKFKYSANQKKFQATNPLTSQYEPERKMTNFQTERMKRLIQKRYPHGIVGIDHAQNPQSKFYINQLTQIKVRKMPMSQTSFDLDRNWKTKKRSKMPVDQWKFRQTVCLRRFRNDNVHGYNIVTNRQYDQ